ncbi:MAG: MFS transporter [Bacilli bacterium]|nr:MFS transporter [Bacilli bacterium]
MTAQSKKSFFETRLMRSRIKSRTVSLFPEAGLGYLVGPILALLGNGVINIWLAQYWDKVLGLSTWAKTFEILLPILSSIFIIVGNILVGRLMERKPTLAGKARPLILLGLPIIVVAMLLLFLVPFPGAAQENAPAGSFEGGLLASIFISVGYVLYYAFAWPMYYTSHSALVNLSTRDGSKRGLLGTAIMAAQLGAAGVSGMAGGWLVKLIGLLPVYEYQTTITNAQGLPEIITVSTNDFAEIVAKQEANPLFTYNPVITRAEANQKWVILMIVMVAALVIGCLLEYFFTRERITEDNIKNAEAAAEGEHKGQAKKVSMGKQIGICMKDKYWWLLMIFWFLYQFGGMMKNNDLSFFSQAFTGDVAASSDINTLGAIPTALGMVIVWPLAAKLTKSKTISLGGVLAALAAAASFSVLALVNKSTILTADSKIAAWKSISIGSFCIKAIGTAPAMYISIALMANVLDHQEAVYGVRTDGFTMAVYGSIMAAMSGVCNGIIMALNNAFTDIYAKQWLHTFLSYGVEGICYLLIAVMFLFMNVEKFTNADNKAIVADQKAEVLAAGGQWVEPDVRAKQEEEENTRLVEEARVEELKEKCEKKGLNFEEENAKFLEKKAEADQKAADKKAAAEAKKQAKLDAMTAEQKVAMEEKAKARKEKQDAKDAAALEELNNIRAAYGRQPIAE